MDVSGYRQTGGLFHETSVSSKKRDLRIFQDIPLSRRVKPSHMLSDVFQHNP